MSFLATIPAPGRFEEILAANSPTYKARKALAKADRLAADLSRRLADIGTALTRGDGSERARTALFDAMLDLRIACGDVESLVRLFEAEAVL
jgi:hypothetical protein